MKPPLGVAFLVEMMKRFTLGILTGSAGVLACALGRWEGVGVFRLDYLDVPVRLDSAYCAQGVGRLQFWEGGVWKTTLVWQSHKTMAVALLWQRGGLGAWGADGSFAAGAWLPLWQWPDLLLGQDSLDLQWLEQWKSQPWGSALPLLQTVWWSGSKMEHWYWGAETPAVLNQIPVQFHGPWWLGNSPQASWSQGLGSPRPDSLPSNQKIPRDVRLGPVSLKVQKLWQGAWDGALMSQGQNSWATRALVLWDQQGRWWLWTGGGVERGECPPRVNKKTTPRGGFEH